MHLSQELLLALSIAVAAIASPIGGLIALWVRPSTLFMSGVLGLTSGGRSEARRILGWTGLIGLSVLVSAVAGWPFLRGLPQPTLGILFGAGVMFYLTVTDLVPKAEEHQYQQLPAVTMGIGFMMIFALSTVL